MIGYGTFKAKRKGLVHLYGPASFGLPITVQAALCGTVTWTNKVVNAWADLYHDYPTPQEAAQAREVTCPRCKRHV